MKVFSFIFKFCKSNLTRRQYTDASRSDCKRICIVGSGPAGFYTAQHILKNSNAHIDIYEKLPVPFGLIRYGVAPDHPEIKVVTNAFTKIAKHDRCTFLGNIDVGRDVKLSELLNAYHAVVLAYGASRDKDIGIPGEDAGNVFSARKFVNWYNGLPDYVDLNVDLTHEVATVIGQGNVALDVARILLKRTDELRSTDISKYAMDALLKSQVKKVVLIGRRGPLQVAFNIKEFRDMLKLKDVATVLSLQDFDGIPEIIEAVPRPRKRLVELLYNTAKEGSKDAPRTLEVKFFRSPKSIVADKCGKVKELVLGINTVDGTSETAKVIHTGKEEKIECGLVLKSVGYQSMAIDSMIPFDPKRYIVPNEEGRVTGLEGLYCSGWVKSGPLGVILSTMNGSYETAEKVLEDMGKEKWFFKDCNGNKEIFNILKRRGVKHTTFDDWLKIDQIEIERGQAEGKSRLKICSLDEMLKIANIE